MAVQTPVPTTIDVAKYIETRFFEDRPHVRGRRVPVATVAYSVRDNGWTVAETAHNYGLSEAEVLAALLYYQEHSNEIDVQEAEEVRLFNEMKARYGDA
jgi:uncharacterized protein (DUF433 family)